jgi:hypothetical protein
MESMTSQHLTLTSQAVTCLTPRSSEMSVRVLGWMDGIVVGGGLWWGTVVDGTVVGGVKLANVDVKHKGHAHMFTCNMYRPA